MHHKATEFDIGIYFEANGHGTIVTEYAKVCGMICGCNSPSAMILLQFLKLTNEAVGDAMTNFLMMEAIM
jgi:phosphoacetylglucosamine mutase